MDNASLSIGLGLLILFFFPIVYSILRQNSKEKRILKEFRNIGEKNQLNLKEVELSNNLILGLDPEAKKLMVAHPKDLETNIIDLSAIDTCMVAKNYTGGRGEKEKTTRVCLELLKNHGREKVSEILFYDEDDEESLDPETRLYIAKKWDQYIQQSISA